MLRGRARKGNAQDDDTVLRSDRIMASPLLLWHCIASLRTPGTIHT
jgi:hypothetical protein